jgi:hypothetical protein
MMTTFADSLNIAAVSHTWVTGDPQRPFEPHQELDGVEFENWDDDRLVNNEPWPPYDFYTPGDHDGCLCDTEITFASAAEASAESAA